MKGKKQTYFLWMLNSPRTSLLRSIGFTVLLLLVMGIAIVPGLWKLWPAALVVLFVTARLCDVVVINQQSIRVYRLFRRSIQLSWENAIYCGTFKASFLREMAWYIYFSTKSKAISPHEGLPDMCEDFVYLTRRDSLWNTVERHFGKQHTKSVFGDSGKRKFESWPLRVWLSVIAAYIVFGALQILALRTGNNVWKYISVLPGLYALLVSLGRLLTIGEK